MHYITAQYDLMFHCYSVYCTVAFVTCFYYLSALLYPSWFLRGGHQRHDVQSSHRSLELAAEHSYQLCFTCSQIQRRAPA